MSSVHDAYRCDAPSRLEPYDGTRCDMSGGEYLGRTARPDLIEAGDIVTVVEGGHNYYDPELLIPGASYVRTNALATQMCIVWTKIRRVDS